MDATTQETGFGFLRDNPFIKNDAAHRRVTNFRQPPPVCIQALATPSFARVTLKSAPLPNAPCAISPRAMDHPPRAPLERAAEQPKEEEAEESRRTRVEETTSTGSASDVEYGPGIVERLRAKFNKLSGLASKDARVSPHATCKRCPSVDDILSENSHSERSAVRAYDTLDRNWGEGGSGEKEAEERPQSGLDGAAEARRRYIVHRQILRQEEENEDVSLPDISSLRRKFEENASRSNWENRRNYQTPQTVPVVRSHSAERSYGSTPSLLSPTSIVTLDIGRTEQKAKPQSEQKDKRRADQKGKPPMEKPPREPSPQPQPPVLREKQNVAKRPVSVDLSTTDVLEVLNRAEAEQGQERVARPIARSATTNDISERTYSPPKQSPRPTFVSPTRRPAPVIPVLSSSARVVPVHPNRTLDGYSSLPKTSKTVAALERPTLLPPEPPKEDCEPIVPKPCENSAAPTVAERPAEMKEVFVLPPDPDSARAERPALFSPPAATHGPPSTDASPPPEEPKPPLIPISSQPVKTIRAPPPPVFMVPKILPRNNDDSGKNEMQRMLNRFNETRDKKMFAESNTEVPQIRRGAPPSRSSSASRPPPTRFVPAVTSVVSSDGRSRHLPSPVRPRQQELPNANVVTIPVRDASPSKQRTAPRPPNGDPEAIRASKPEEISPPKRAAPPPPTQQPLTETIAISAPTTAPAAPLGPVQDYKPLSAKPAYDSPQDQPQNKEPTSQLESQPGFQQRKSLSAQFLEQQAKLGGESIKSEKPYGDDVTEIKTEETEITSSVVETPSAADADVESLTSDCDSSDEYSVCEEPAGVRAKYTINATIAEDQKKEAVLGEEDSKDSNELMDQACDVDSLDGTTPGSEETVVREEKDGEDSCDEVPDIAAVERHLNGNTEQDSEDTDSDDEEPPLTLLNGFASHSLSLMGGDGNPVRNSLISLVMEEDIPMLMEAMSETFKFEFVDLNGNQQPSTSSILHPPEKRQKRRIDRMVGRISFAESTPSVYAYLDERTAERDGWKDGSHVSFEAYQAIIEEEQAEQLRQVEELERWKASIAERQTRVELEPEESDSALGVTSRFAYQTHTENSTISV